MAQPFNETFRFGSARWATKRDIDRAGLFTRKGPQLGFFGKRPIHIEGDAPILTVGGAGSGKLRDILGYVICNSPGQRMLLLDPRADLLAISQHVHAAHGEHAPPWDPLGLSGLPSHACNPLDILDPSAPTFHTDCKFICEGLVAASDKEDGYFVGRARQWIASFLKHLAFRNGSVSLPELVDLVDSIESDHEVWAGHLRDMLNCNLASVRRTAGEALSKQQDSPKEFGSIMGTIYGALDFLDDPKLLHSLRKSEFSLKDLLDPETVRKIFLNIPAEYLGPWSPLVRIIFTVVMLYKARQPEADQIMLLVDEAGQLGKFEALLRAFTFGRGAGIRAWAVFQDTGQIQRNFGRDALQGFLGSAQTRQFLGVRDPFTAKIVSDMCGHETLHYDDAEHQDHARWRQHDAFAKMFGDNADPFKAAAQFARARADARRRSEQQRLLVTPAEVMALPEDRQILFVSGMDLPPILAEKYPYFDQREMAGKFMPNPYHPPTDRVRYRTWWGYRTVPIIETTVPKKFAGFPQYRDGTMRFPKGFQPR